MKRRVRTRDDQRAEFLQLRCREPGCPARSAARSLAIHTDLVVLVHIVPQGLPVHGRVPRGILAAVALQHHGNCQEPSMTAV